jgi:hypothetical protein
MLADEVKELINLLRNLNARGHWTEQEMCEKSGGKNAQGKLAYDTRQIKIHNEMRAWANVDSLPDWPLGATQLQFYALEGDWPNFSSILVLMVKIAQAALRSPNGARSYRRGAPLHYHTLGLNMPAVRGLVSPMKSSRPSCMVSHTYLTS